MSVSVSVNLKGLEKMASDSETKKRQSEYAQRVAFVMREYVPLRDGYLRNSEPLSSNYEKGELVWDTPYAAEQYYIPMNHTTAGTTDHWDEPVRRSHMSDLQKYVSAMFDDYK